MFNLSIDDKGNKLIITVKDYFGLQQAEQFYVELAKSVPKLKKGFIVLTDLSSLERMDISARLLIEKAMDLFNKNGVSRVIRIIPDQEKDIGLNIMSLFHYSSGIAIHTYKSYREAESILHK
ncbi:MAG: hypothetical protein PHU96_02250 [Candidatus Omnitrophica bacterium]|nr:hypothetical protein [Candidatus Omnitrophota bacterium]